ncbi:Prp19/Pso4-like-domain-containing protein [Lipomyces starkeyi]
MTKLTCAVYNSFFLDCFAKTNLYFSVVDEMAKSYGGRLLYNQELCGSRKPFLRSPIICSGAIHIPIELLKYPGKYQISHCLEILWIAMLCALTGKPVTNPVVSKKSGGVFEKTSRIVPARASTTETIPSLLQVFQNEYDALALESFELKKQLLEARKELSSTLYYHDAAVKVAARLMNERDEARAAIKRLSNGTDGETDAMETDK